PLILPTTWNRDAAPSQDEQGDGENEAERVADRIEVALLLPVVQLVPPRQALLRHAPAVRAVGNGDALGPGHGQQVAVLPGLEPDRRAFVQAEPAGAGPFAG